MTGDYPRRRNELFDTTSIGQYLDGYADRLRQALDSINRDALDHARRLIEHACATGRRIYSIGNGGSAAISDHLCCDWMTGTCSETHPVIDATSLTANMANYSAIANDYGFEEVFVRQLRMLGRKDDVLVAISSSGNSPNIVKAIETARAIGMHTIGLSGFSGGGLRSSVDVSLHVNVANYGVVEDAHQSIIHVLAQFIASRRDGLA